MNRKIINATVVSNSYVKFKSKLEKVVYNCLLENGFNVEYEPKQHILIPSFTSDIPFFDKESDSMYKKRRDKGDRRPRMLVKKSGNFQKIGYTPDFYFNYKGINIYIEAKGFENDVFYIKKKLFLKYLSENKENAMYFEIYSKAQVVQAIKIIKEYAEKLTAD
jgi:hypothetical protein